MYTYQGDYTVYVHRNKTNGKVYAGITNQKAHKRWKNGNGYKSKRFREDINRYGWDDFEHITIIDGVDQTIAMEMEKAIINAFHLTDPVYGYNYTHGGDLSGMYGKHQSAETKEKISRARKKAGFTEEHKKHISESKSGLRHHHAKPVYQYKKSGEFVRKWEYMSKAADALKIPKTGISATCLKRRPSAGGYVWSYEGR